MKRLMILVAACAAAVLLTSPRATYAQHDDPDMEWEEVGDEAAAGETLFARLGGQEKITGVVEDFVSLVMADEKLKAHFEKTDTAQWKKDLAGQITKASGGETDFAGKTVKESLTGMGVTEEGLQEVAKHLSASLEKHQINKADSDSLLVTLELKKAEPEPSAQQQ
jgi:truncated hemoglobin YjbI